MAEPHEQLGRICFQGKRQDNHLDLTWKGAVQRLLWDLPFQQGNYLLLWQKQFMVIC